MTIANPNGAGILTGLSAIVARAHVTFMLALFACFALAPLRWRDDGACMPDRPVVDATPAARCASWRAPRHDDALAGISRLDAQSVRIKPNTVEYLRSADADFWHSVHLVPRFARDGSAQGLMLYGVREGTLFHKMGFERGDVITRLGPYPLTTWAQTRQAYDALAGVASLTVTVVREGIERTLVVEIDRTLPRTRACFDP
jgi:membrane-associated protease RseP (regulator of RpoE activity)